jgi:hypothetical protein
MKTVRLSSNLRYDIRRQARHKFNKVNPMKEYPTDGYSVLKRYGILDKLEQTSKYFQELWGRSIPTETTSSITIKGEFTHFRSDEDGEEYEVNNDHTYTLSVPNVEIPSFLMRYGDYYINVPSDDETFVECMSVHMYNDKLENQERDYMNKITVALDKFSTLNQLLKNASWLKDLVPQERLQKMYEKDDRKARATEQAELAENELSDLREVLLEDKLMGDD